MDEYARFMRGVDVSSTRRLAGHRHPHRGRDRRVERRPLSELHGSRSPSRRRHLPQRQRRRLAGQGAAGDLQRDPGGQQRVRVGQPAGLGERARHLPEPGLHGHVPARRRCQAALARQPQAVPVRPRRHRQAAARRLDRHLGGELVDRLHQPERGARSGPRPSTFWSNQLLGTPLSSRRLARRRDRREGRGGAAPAATQFATSQDYAQRAHLRRLRRGHAARRRASRRASSSANTLDHRHRMLGVSGSTDAQRADRLGARHRQRRRRARPDDRRRSTTVSAVGPRRRPPFASGGRQLRRQHRRGRASTAPTTACCTPSTATRPEPAPATSCGASCRRRCSPS